MPISTPHVPEFLIAKITVTDLDKSLDFYKRVVGLQEATDDGVVKPRNPKAAFEEIGLNYSGSRKDARIMLVRQNGLTPTRATAQLTWIAFHVPDVHAVMERIKAEGFEVRQDTAQWANMTYALALDPDGYVVEFIHETADK
jgi:catechol 2,3-dioxygenase-like lactoylglutathione lyase family enzyme